MKIATILCISSLFIGNFAAAGIPTEEPVTCPVGGETFIITGTMSCSGNDKTMLLRTVTSCDFVTRLPICPSNGLPMYQKFDQTQIENLSAFVETDTYADVRGLAPWLRAYAIAEHLEQSTTPVGFGILLNAMWYDPDPFFESAVALDQFLLEAEHELARTPEENRPFLNAILAHSLALAGRLEEANEKLSQAISASDGNEYLQAYIGAVESCQSRIGDSDCQPNAPFNP